MVNAIEKSVRRSMAKGDADDPDFRVLVYEAAERAINRGESEGRTKPEEADAQRRDLIAAVEAIETDYPPVGQDRPDYGEAKISSSDSVGPARSTKSASETGTETKAGAPNAFEGYSDIDEAFLTSNGERSETAGVPRSSEDVVKHVEADMASGGPFGEGTAKSGEAEPDARWSPQVKRRSKRGVKAPSRAIAALVAALLLFLLAVAAYLLLPILLPSYFASIDRGREDSIAQTIDGSRNGSQ